LGMGKPPNDTIHQWIQIYSISRKAYRFMVWV
jgi:hypothetical protein